MTKAQEEVEFDEDTGEDEQTPASTSAIVQGTDWTTETIINQLRRRNILLDPTFQRRDAWNRARKSKFIESLIMGLPIPQIVLAESKQAKGQFLVLDGKQRLLSISQFWGIQEGPNNNFRLSGMTLKPKLANKTIVDLERAHPQDYNALCNQTIRTVVIRNWKNDEFLHTVFLRLNTGSVSLSPQELRQALLPGEFTRYVDDAAAESKSLQKLLGIDHPDSRMRDVEILARYLSFKFFADIYPGRMKTFLDRAFASLNENWSEHAASVGREVQNFDKGIDSLMNVFGEKLARKPNSRQFNRAIFDALIYFHSSPAIRRACTNKDAQLRVAYGNLFKNDSAFTSSIESDTAGIPNTKVRLGAWARQLTEVTGKTITIPNLGTDESLEEGVRSNGRPTSAAKSRARR